ncbi:MAG: universal stress protein [Desulfobacteraceae bacterium]|nr:MAG: universal stress protein [Desulfobacteraceae bacterium]
MKAYKKILVAVDGSEASLNALTEAVRLSYWVRGRVLVISVVPPYEGDLRSGFAGNIKTLLREPCEKVLGKIKETSEEIGAAVEAVCKEGEPFEKITEFAETEGCDLIVTGIEEKHSLHRALIRGVTEKLAEHGKKDVLIIPNDTQIDWNRILIMADGSQSGRISAIRAIEIAKTYGSELFVASVSQKRSVPAKQKPEEYLREIESLSSGASVRFSVKAVNNVKEISNLAAEHEADLILIGFSARKSIGKPIASKIIYSSPCPVLIVKK